MPVSCTERGRWAYNTKKFKDSSVLSSPSVRACVSSSVAYSLGSQSKHASDQSKVWHNIEAELDYTDTHSGTSALKDAFEKNANEIESFQKALRPQPGQTGVLVMVGGKIRAMEFFSTSAAYAKFHDKIIGSHALDMIGGGSRPSSEGSSHEVFESFIEGLQELAPDIHEGVGRGLDLRLESKNLTGSALCVDDVIVHSSILIR